MRDVIGNIHAARDRIGMIARDNGLAPLASATNFVAIDCGRDGTYARAIVDGLIEHGVFIRMPGVAAAEPLHTRQRRAASGSRSVSSEALAGGPQDAWLNA